MNDIASIVIKFGGTSVSTASNIRTIVSIARRLEKKHPVIVVSALSGVTDLLLACANISVSDTDEKIAQIRQRHESLIQELWQDEGLRQEIISYIDKQLLSVSKLLQRKKKDKCFFDLVVSYGEIMSSCIISKFLQNQGIQSEQVIATKLIVTDNHFGSAEFQARDTEINTRKVIIPLLKKRIVPVITGFIGATKNGETTTLGRGGSDYSASIIGYSLHASEIQIWTDVNGIFTADPRIVKNARPISQVSYREASEMAYFGAKVLHPRTIRPAIKAEIPVRVLNTLNPDHPGTIITRNSSLANSLTAVTCKRRTTLVNMYAAEMFLKKGFLVRIFDAFAKEYMSIDFVSASEVSVSVTLDNDERLENAVKILEKFTTVSINKDVATVSLIGEGIGKNSEIILSSFSILKKNNISVKMISFNAANINVGFVISAEHVELAVQKLHDGLL